LRELRKKRERWAVGRERGSVQGNEEELMEERFPRCIVII
jgi:hypothetical protein